MMEQQDWRKESMAEDTKGIRIDARGGTMVELPSTGSSALSAIHKNA